MSVKKERKKEPSKYEKELVIARIDAQLPSRLKLFMGANKSLTKEEMIKHVKNGDKIGQEIVESHLSFIRALASGQFTKAIVSV